MSYCKGDVYFYRNGDYFVCHKCKLIEPSLLTPVFDTRLEAVDHLRAHLAKGHDVPPGAFARLWREIELQGF